MYCASLSVNVFFKIVSMATVISIDSPIVTGGKYAILVHVYSLRCMYICTVVPF